MDRDALFMDEQSELFFYADPKKILRMVSRLNKVKKRRCLNDIYKVIGLPDMSYGDRISWRPNKKIRVIFECVPKEFCDEEQIILVYFDNFDVI